MKVFINFLICFIIIFILLFLLDYLIRLKGNRLGGTRAFQFIEKKYKLSMNKKRAKTLAFSLVLINSIIIAIPISLMITYDINLILMLILAFLIFIILILTCYNLLGMILKKKGW